MRVLVTGGAGFIGSHIVRELVARGDEVRVLDNLSSGRRANLEAVDAELLVGDLTDPDAVRAALSGVTHVIHLAALVSVPRSIAEPELSHAVNVTGTLGLLVAARDLSVRRVVIASSSAVYGDTGGVNDEGLPLRPTSPYGVDKMAAEAYAATFHRLYGLETVSLRYFNVFGPRQAFNSPYSGVIARFCTTLLAGERPTIFGDGGQSRDFIYVENVVAANLLAAEAPAGRAAGRVFNVGGGQSITLLELAAELQRLTQPELAPGFAPARAGDVRASLAEITAARQALGYDVRVPWQAGLERTLAFYRGSATGGLPRGGPAG